MERNIYLNRKLHYSHFMNKAPIRNKVLVFLLLFLGFVLIISFKDIIHSIRSNYNILQPLKEKENENESVSELKNKGNNTIQSKKNYDDTKENNGTLFRNTIKTNISLHNNQYTHYFSHCYLHMKQFEIFMLFKLNKAKTKIELVSSYSHNKVIKNKEGYCSTGGMMLVSFNNITNYSPKCIEIKGIGNKSKSHFSLDSNIQMSLVSIIIKGNEVHLYELKKETINASLLSHIDNSHYKLMNNALYYNYSFRFCLNESEQSTFEKKLNADKGIEINWNKNNRNDFCFESISFIY